MHPAILLDFVNVFFAGLLAGMELVLHYGLLVPVAVLDDHAQLQFRQALVLRVRVLVPAFFVPTLGSGIAVTLLDSAAPGLWLRYLGVFAMLIWILIRVVGTVPINSATLDWQLNDPPKNWKERINHAERFHIVGTWAAVMTFAFFLAALALKLTTF